MIASALISCITFNPPQAAQDKLAERGVQWAVLNSRLGRDLVDIIGDKGDLLWIKQRLTAAGLDPLVIMAWRADSGQQVKGMTFDLPTYLAVAPDVWDFTDPLHPVASRPTTYAQTHAWAGWTMQSSTVEP